MEDADAARAPALALAARAPALALELQPHAAGPALEAHRPCTGCRRPPGPSPGHELSGLRRSRTRTAGIGVSEAAAALARWPAPAGPEPGLVRAARTARQPSASSLVRPGAAGGGPGLRVRLAG